jgi:hypothetical protein
MMDRDILIRLMTVDDIDAACRLVGQFDVALASEARECFELDLRNPADWPDRRYRIVADIDGTIVARWALPKGRCPSMMFVGPIGFSLMRSSAGVE